MHPSAVNELQPHEENFTKLPWLLNITNLIPTDHLSDALNQQVCFAKYAT